MMSEPPIKGSSAPEVTAKKTFRQLWEYGQQIGSASRTAKHTIDLFAPELKLLRKRLRDKCSKILLLRESSWSHKAEDLLWKRGFYDVIQRCKQRKEALDPNSPLRECYSKHISSAVKFYDRLLYKMEREFGVESSQLSAMNDAGVGFHWLKNVMYRCFIHLGDLARYQVVMGESTHVAVAYYHKAITLDPRNGTAFNQLAVLMGGRNESLDSIYYYQRSIASAQPFSGSEANMMSLFEKNQQALGRFQSQVHATDYDLRGAAKRLLFLQFIKLQHALSPGSKRTNSQDKFLSTLCQDTLDSFKQCLDYDLQTFKEDSNAVVASVLSGNTYSVASDRVLLPPDVILKLTALSILPSHSLRQLGSTLTQVATAFALSIFSTLLWHSYQRIVQIVVSTLNTKYDSSTPEGPDVATPSELEITDALDHGKSIVNILLEHGISAVSAQPTEVKIGDSQENVTVAASDKLGSSPAKPKKRRVVDRRRSRRRNPVQEGIGSSDEESGSDSDSDVSSDECLSVLSEDLGEDDLELLDSFSDSSSSEPEDVGVEKPQLDEATPLLGAAASSPAGVPLSPVKRTGKRKIILAANFTMPPNTSNQGTAHKPDPDKHAADKSPPPVPSLLVQTPTSPKAGMESRKSTEIQMSVYTACSLVAEESSLMALRVFVYWLHSYPIIIATCTQSSATMWSRIASLINILPTKPEIMNSNIAGVMGEHKWPLLEDLLLREFPPILPALQATQYGTEETLSSIQESSCRICSLQCFGHFLAEARTAPSFTFDDSTEKFDGPEQKALKESDMAKATEEQEKKQVELNRSKLMKAMAQRRLQSEINSLAEATSKTESTVFTPYLIPDANSLCSGLHIVKKLVKTEKFVFIIAKAVIESLDNMKKSRESYAAREAIKFLEKELHGGNKFIQAQKVAESLNPGKKKPSKMEMQDWLLECLVDCACYFNQTYAQKGQTRAVATLIIEKRILDAFSEATKPAESPQVAEILMTAQQNGVDLETMIGFHINWSKNFKKRTPLAQKH